MKRRASPLAFDTQPNFVVDKIDHFNFDGDPLEYFSLKGVIKKVGTAIKNTAEDYGKGIINNLAAAGRVVGLKTENPFSADEFNNEKFGKFSQGYSKVLEVGGTIASSVYGGPVLKAGMNAISVAQSLKGSSEGSASSNIVANSNLTASNQPYNGNSIGNPSNPGEDNSMLFVGIGAAVLVVILILVLITTKK